MKKIRLHLKELKNADVLTREQLKKISGGSSASTFCEDPSFVYYTSGTTQYKCATEWKNGQEICCYGHFPGDEQERIP